MIPVHVSKAGTSDHLHMIMNALVSNHKLARTVNANFVHVASFLPTFLLLGDNMFLLSCFYDCLSYCNMACTLSYSTSEQNNKHNTLSHEQNREIPF